MASLYCSGKILEEALGWKILGTKNVLSQKWVQYYDLHYFRQKTKKYFTAKTPGKVVSFSGCSEIFSLQNCVVFKMTVKSEWYSCGFVCVKLFVTIIMVTLAPHLLYGRSGRLASKWRLCYGPLAHWHWIQTCKFLIKSKDKVKLGRSFANQHVSS